MIIRFKYLNLIKDKGKDRSLIEKSERFSRNLRKVASNVLRLTL